MDRIVTWGKRPFQLVLWGCSLFVVATFIAMLVCPGGTKSDPGTSGYTFFHNFFSELGFTVTEGGFPNPIAAPLFFVALTLAGLGLVLYFVVIPQFFWDTRWLKVLSLGGSFFGVISGFAYVGIAFTPANLLPDPHLEFVLLAFRAFLPAVFFYILAIFFNPGYPNRFAGLYLAFAGLLAAYILLITRGPDIDTAQGVMIQATGQKIIVYAAITTIFIQSWGAIRLLERENINFDLNVNLTELNKIKTDIQKNSGELDENEVYSAAIHIIKSPQVYPIPKKNRTTLIAIIGFIVGFLIIVFLVFFIEYLKSSSDVKNKQE